MRAVVCEGVGRLRVEERAVPVPKEGEILVRVDACGVCRTDLHLLDGELRGARFPVVPGHQAVGRVVEGGGGRFAPSDRVGVPWLGWACGTCADCLGDRENLCAWARFTGHSVDGGFAEYLVADERFALGIPDRFPSVHAAPLLCAGAIGFRSLSMTGKAQRLGLYGFGASAHLVLQVARFQGRDSYVFTRPGDQKGQERALARGAAWAGDSTAPAPEPLDAAILFASAGELVPLALRAVRPGGVVVCAGIHMTPIPSFPYELLWGERCVRSVANLTREDGAAFLELAERIPIETEVEVFPLGEAPEALEAVRAGRVEGSAVLEVLAE
jgi:propanol-preferring alcohol dehydrogenase